MISMDISLRDLYLFAETARLGNISKAARSVGVTQPALSWTIKKLEDQVGTGLFHRSKKGVVLTHAGETFLARSRTLVRRWERLADGLVEDEKEHRGTYVLGVHPTLAAAVLPRFVPDLLHDYPEIHLKVAHDNSRTIAEGVIEFKYDFGIVVNPPQHPDLTIRKLYDDHILFWTLPQPSKLQDLTSEDAVVWLNSQMLYAEGMLHEASAQLGWRARRMIESTSLAVIARIAASGGGVALLPKTVKYAFGNNLVAIPGTPRHTDKICLIWRHDASHSVAAKTIRDRIMASIQSIPHEPSTE